MSKVATVGVPTSRPDGSRIKEWFDEYGARVISGYDPATNTILVSQPSPFASGNWAEEIIDVTLDNDPTSYTSAAYFIGDCNKEAFTFISDVTAVGNAPEVTYTIEVSHDDSEWTETFFFTDDGTDAPVTSITHSADTEEVAYLPDGLTAQYVRVVATGTDTDADDNVACLVVLSVKKG